LLRNPHILEYEEHERVNIYMPEMRLCDG
jgi:hypothetical protein